MSDQAEFDAADLAESILGLDETTEPATGAATDPTSDPASGPSLASGTVKTPGNGLGWTLLIALVIAVCVAISLAIQLAPERARPPDVPDCGGLYAPCCDDPDDGWRTCPEPCELPRDEFSRGGLFDAEEDFADRRLPPGC